MQPAIDITKRENHFGTVFTYSDLNHLNYHLFGADKTLTGKNVSSNEFLYYYYRSKIEEKIIKYLVNKYCDKLDSALDCGAGTARVANILSGIFKKVDAFDPSAAFIEENKKRFADVSNIDFTTSSFAGFSADGKKYDLIFVGGVFMYLNEDEFACALKKIKDMLSETGVLISRDSISRNEDKPVGSLKVYRAEKNYLSFFKNDFSFAAKLNSTNRNIWCTLHRYLPKGIAENKLFLSALLKLMDYSLIFNFLKILLLGRRRHPLAHQLFYIFKPN